MYLLSIFLLIVLCISYTLLSFGGNITYYIDAPSFILLILIALPNLIGAGLLKDFNNAFKLSVKRKEPCTRTELLRAIEAVSLASKALLASGIFNTVFPIIQIMVKKDNRFLVGQIAVSLITLLYAVFFVILLLPLKSRLLVRLHELPEDFVKSDTAGSVNTNSNDITL